MHAEAGTISTTLPAPALDFAGISVADLAAMSPTRLDELPFGVIGMSPSGVAEVYNSTESRLAGLSPARVLGQHVFTAVAPCMNNYLVAQRFDDEAELDAIVPYVLTLRMRPTPVKLRLLRTAACARRFLLIHR